MRQAEEYMSVLVSMELCAVIARKEGKPISSSVRACCDVILGRITDESNRAIVKGVKRQIFPVGAIAMLRRQLDSMVTNGKMD